MLPLFNELFVRSHCFRELFILHINEFISLTLGMYYIISIRKTIINNNYH